MPLQAPAVELAAASLRNPAAAATETLSRGMALGTGLIWAYYLSVGYADTHVSGWGPAALAAGWLMYICALLTAASAAVPRRGFSALMMGLTGGVYVVVLAVHTALLLLGNDVLLILAPGDYSGLPLMMLAAAFTGSWVVPVLVAVLVAAILTNDGMVGTEPWHQFIGVAHAFFLLMPFLYFLYAAFRTTRAMDRLAERSLRTSLEYAQGGVLAQYRARFLGFIHDRVLPILAGIPTGVTSVDDLARLEGEFEEVQGGTVELSWVVETWRETLTNADPALTVNVADTFSSPAFAHATVSRGVVTVMTEALLEAVTNARSYAPEADRAVSITYAADQGRVTRLEAAVSDNGPGFDPASVKPGRAGIRIAILGRMASVVGGEAHVGSSIRKGTNVRIAWDAERAVSPEPADVPQAPTLYDLLGYHELLRPVYGAAFFLFAVAMSATAWPVTRWGWYALALASVAATVVALSQAPRQQPPLTWVVVGTLGVAGTLLFGGLSMAAAVPGWPDQWYIRVALLLAAYLVLRGGGWIPILGWALAAVVHGWLAGIGLVPADTTTLELFLRSALILAALLLPFLVMQVSRRIPTAVNQGLAAGLASGLAALEASLTSVASTWLSAQLALVRADPSLAPLLQQRLRDCISAPGLDVPSLTAAVWSARARGASILLIDDRVTAPAPNAAPDGASADLPGTAGLPAAVTDVLLPALSSCGDGGSLTLRMYPPGRDTLASVRWQPAAGAEPTLVRIPRG